MQKLGNFTCITIRTTALELCVSVSGLAVVVHKSPPPCQRKSTMKRQHWDPSDTQEQGVSGALATSLALASMSSNTPMTILANLRIPPPLEDSTVFTCFTNSSSLEELSSELKSLTLPTSSAARLLHLQLLPQVEDHHLHHQPQLVNGEDSPPPPSVVEVFILVSRSARSPPGLPATDLNTICLQVKPLPRLLWEKADFRTVRHF